MRCSTDTHRYVERWLRDADELLAWCLNDVDWQREYVHIAGRKVEVPRRVAWFGDAGCAYRYSGCDHVADGWPTELKRVSSRLKREGWIRANFVLLNLYRDGADSMGMPLERLLYSQITRHR